jgi:16S rRNA (guanine1516-N2)-methyltransferase
VVIADSDDPAFKQAAQKLARELRLQFDASLKGHDLALAVREDKLELRDTESRPGRGVSVDFSTLNPKRASRKSGLSRHQPLARAIGKDSQVVLDATAGLGHDSALLACMGFDVIAVERSPVIAALLRDGLQRALQIDGLRERLEGRLAIINADAREVLQRGDLQVDAVYIDPMFPPKRKASALAKKSIRIVRAVVGDDEDAAALFDSARTACRRVVVKRPTYAPPLADRPTASLTGKLVRYDIYAR